MKRDSDSYACVIDACCTVNCTLMYCRHRPMYTVCENKIKLTRSCGSIIFFKFRVVF